MNYLEPWGRKTRLSVPEQTTNLSIVFLLNIHEEDII